VITVKERAVFVVLRTFHTNHPQDFTREAFHQKPTMSDSSGDSSIGVEFSDVNTALLNQLGTSSQVRESGLTEISSEFESLSSSEEAGSGAALVESTPMSKKLGHVDIFAMTTKLDEIHAWMKGLVDDSTEDHVYIQKSTLRRHKKGIDTMRHCLRDTAPMAVK
jgi:hypothetical protein